MRLAGAVVLVTGANRGLGLEFAKQALARGAAKVYAGARNPASVTLAGTVPIKLDVTKPEEIAAATRVAGDVNVLINNAGIARQPGGYLAENSVEFLREQLETNLFGMLNVSRAFAGILAKNGGGVLLNVLSVASWINRPVLGTYGITKAAAWALTNGLRHELRPQGTQVVGFHAGFIDTDLTRDIDAPKASADDVVRLALDGVEAGEEEVTADEMSRQTKLGLSQGVYLRA